MAEVVKYYEKNIIFMHLFAQFRPEPHWPFLIKCFYYLHRLFIYSCFLATVIFTTLLIYFDGFNQISDVALHILNILLYSSILIRTSIFMYRHEGVDYLIKRTNMIMRESTSFTFKKHTMEKSRRLADGALITWMSFVLLCGLILAFSPLFKSTRDLPLPMWLFYDWTADIYFHVTLVIQTLAQIYMVCCFANIEMFNICNHIILKYQFELLGDDFKYLIPNVLHKCGMTIQEVEEYVVNTENEKLVEIVDRISRTNMFKKGAVENLKVCLKHHQELLVYRDEFYKFISPLLMIELDFIFTYIIFVLFTLVTTDDKAMYVTMGIYCYAIMAQAFIICFVGELLTNQTEDLRTILYDIPWYICDLKFLIDFKCLQMRMIRNDYLRAGKLLPVSLEFYLELVKKAASFLAVLRQVNDQ